MRLFSGPIAMAAMVAIVGVPLLATAGCGGGGTITAPISTPTPAPNRFAGTYQGPWTATSPFDTEVGTMTVTVRSDGTFTGTAINTTLGGATATLAGTVTDAGALNASYTYPGQSALTVTGPVSLNSAGHLTGTLNVTAGATSFGTLSVDLTKS